MNPRAVFFYLHCLLVMVYVLILVVGGITGVDAVHLLHDAVCIRPKLLCGLVGGQILIGEQRLTDVEIHEAY